MSPLLAAVPTALLGGAPARQADLDAAERVMTAPLALNRRIGVVQLSGGQGASATASAVAALITRRRRTPVLAVDAAAGPRSLRWHAGLGDTAPTPLDPRRVRPRSAADALAGLETTPAGVALLDVHDGDDPRAVAEHGWAAAVAPLARFVQVICTDWGVRGAEADLGAVAAASTLVCIVARADRAVLEHAVDAALAVRGAPSHPQVVVAAVDVGRTAPRLTADLAVRAPVPVVRIPFEPARTHGRPVTGRECSAATRTAVIRLGAAVMTQPVPVRIAS